MSMSRWFVVSDDPDSGHGGFVEAATAEGAVKAWVGDHYDSSGVYVARAEHVTLFKPASNPVTVWAEAPLDG